YTAGSPSRLRASRREPRRFGRGPLGRVFPHAPPQTPTGIQRAPAARLGACTGPCGRTPSRRSLQPLFTRNPAAAAYISFREGTRMAEETEPKAEKQAGNLELNKETLQDLTELEAEQAKGGTIALSAAHCVRGTADPTSATVLTS